MGDCSKIPTTVLTGTIPRTNCLLNQGLLGGHGTKPADVIKYSDEQYRNTGGSLPKNVRKTKEEKAEALRIYRAERDAYSKEVKAKRAKQAEERKNDKAKTKN